MSLFTASAAGGTVLAPGIGMAEGECAMPAGAPGAVSPAARGEDFRGRVLVIDDELGPRESVRFLFKDRHDVACAASVDEGLLLLREFEPDVVVLDIRMPGKSGIDGLREIRAVDANVEIIMLTGFGSLKTAQEAMRHGANDYVRKPFDTKEMRDVVALHIGRARMQRRRSAAVRDLQAMNRQLQNEVAEKARLAELGQLSSEFFHDLRSPLSAIYGYAQLLTADLENTSQWEKRSVAEAAQYLSIIERNVERCETMIRQWRERKQPGSGSMRVSVSVSQLLTDVAENAIPLATSSGARISVEPAARDGSVLVEPLDMHRAIQNLVSNALQALPSVGGHVRLTWAVESAHVEIMVVDNGNGIRESDLENMFKPYFTTKKQSGGTGLGLIITRNIVEAHGGAVRLANNPGGGVTAQVILPLERPA